MTTELNLDEIIDKLKIADDAYFNSSDVVMSDAEYDNLKRAAEKINSKHPYFMEVGADVRAGKVKLPYPMNGLTQVYDLESWVKSESLQDEEIIQTDKLDGTSTELVYADKDGDGDAEFINAYSRGNSLEGADISRHMKHMDFPKVIPNCTLFVVRAENIMKEKVFQEKYKGKFATARGMVAGCMNRTETDHKHLKDISVIAYTIIDNDGPMLDKVESLAKLRSLGFIIPNVEVMKGKSIKDINCIENLKLSKKRSEYELDGYVYSTKSGESVKFKIVDEDSIVLSKVKKVHWEVSKNGFQKPRVEIDPVILYGTVVTFATGFNARFISDNCIGPGAVVKITKAGSVIPYILEVTKPAMSGKPDFPAGDNVWNSNDVELVVKDPENHPEVLFKLVLDFFDTLSVEHLKEASMKTLFDRLKFWTESYDYIIGTLFDLTESEWSKLIGANGVKIYESLRRRLDNMKHETLLGAVKYFGFGFGVRKAKAILEQISYDEFLNATVKDIVKLDGFDTTMAERVIEGLPAYKKFIDDNKAYVTFVVNTKTDELKNIAVVFTGFRDSELEERVEKMGGKIQSGVSKKTTYLVSVDGDSGSSKCKKAKDLGVGILTVTEFKDKFNL